MADHRRSDSDRHLSRLPFFDIDFDRVKKRRLPHNVYTVELAEKKNPKAWAVHGKARCTLYVEK